MKLGNRNNFLLALLALMPLQLLFADPVTFTVDQSKSSIFITGTFSGLAFQPQATGSLTTAYTGTIEVDLTPTDITFTGGSLVIGVNNGSWRPGLGGTVSTDTAPGNYGGKIVNILVTAYAAVRQTLFDVTSPTMTMDSGTFPATNLVFSFPLIANTVIDYNYSGLIGSGAGSQPLEGTFPNNINSNATLVVQGGNYVLTIPVDITGTASALSADDIVYRLRGNLVSTAPAPIQPVTLKITSFQVAGNQATMKIDTTPSQHFTILGTTNFTTWTTNDAFTSSTTNTTRVFALPAITRQFYRVRKD